MMTSSATSSSSRSLLLLLRGQRACTSGRRAFHHGCRSPLLAREPATEAAFPEYNAPTGLYINNKFTAPVSGRSFAVHNPGNDSVITEVAEGDAADVDVAVAAAREAFVNGPWTRQMTPRERGAALYRLADLVDAHREELAVIEALNNGKSLNDTRNIDAPACATILRYWAGWADKITGKSIPIGPDHFCYTRHEAVGVVGAIVPWNLPLIALAAKLGPALTCGNTVVLKTAEQTPLSALKVASLIEEAGFPPGVVNVVSGFGETVGAALAKHMQVDKVSFTGSLEVGKKIMSMAAQSNLKRVTLELGGKNPSIVFADADIDATIEQVHNGLFWNKGEACAAGTRIFVEESVYDEFLRRSVERVQRRRVGNPFAADTEHGALASAEQMRKVLAYIDGAKQQGAEVLTGGGRVGSVGCYVEPTVLANVTDDMTVFQEEVFGPVMTMVPFKSVDEVVARANNSPYGLAAGVFTNDVTKGYDVAARLRSGMVFWNCYHVVDVAAPFGGFKQSGFGREGGEYGLLPYLEVKNVVQRIK